MKGLILTDVDGNREDPVIVYGVIRESAKAAAAVAALNTRASANALGFNETPAGWSGPGVRFAIVDVDGTVDAGDNVVGSSEMFTDPDEEE